VIQHVDVKTELAVYEVPGFLPCAVISDDARRDYTATMSEQPFGYFNVHLVNSGVGP
jgi:hypothetical protein